MNEEEVNKAVARVILSTKRVKRQYSLYDIASDIEFLKGAKGNIKEVSKVIGISPGMLNQFLSVFKLPIDIVELVKNRKIDSVSIINSLSKLENKDVLELSEMLRNNLISSHDLRVLIPYRKQFPNESIEELVKRIRSSKNIKVYVLRISKQDTTKPLEELEKIFTDSVGSENLHSIEQTNDFINIKIFKEGERCLRGKAKSKKITLQELVSNLVQ